jgi:hypothetical protein
MIFSPRKKDINTVHRYYYAYNIIPTKQIIKYKGIFIDAKVTW